MTPVQQPSRRDRSVLGRRARRAEGEGGLALVEFAIIAPLLFLLIFGIIDFGWAFFQQLDVRHGAREGARLAAVNYKTSAAPTPADQLTQLITAACDRMDADDDLAVLFHRPSTAAVGQPIEVFVKKEPLQTLTGFMDSFLPEQTVSNVRIRIEQDATWESMPATLPTPTDAQYRDCP